MDKIKITPKVVALRKKPTGLRKDLAWKKYVSITVRSMTVQDVNAKAAGVKPLAKRWRKDAQEVDR